MKFRYLILAIFSVLLIILVAAYFLIIKPVPDLQKNPVQPSDSLLAPPPVMTEYGLPVDSFIIISGRIRKNQVLSDLFYDA